MTRLKNCVYIVAPTHVETVVNAFPQKNDSVINVKVEFGEDEGKVPLDNIAKRAAAYKPKERVTYKMIKEYIVVKHGFKVHTAYIAEVKRELGLPMYDAPNVVEELKQQRKYKYILPGEHNNRWGWDGEKYNYTSSLLNDYENVLSALVALQINQQEQFIKDCKQREKNGENHNVVPEMVMDKLRIWKSVFPHRNIIIEDGKVLAGFEKGGQYFEYKGRDMSDGERVGLYLMAQSLCVHSDKTIIIDEPEIHLHRSIMNRLREAIEAEREDCFFIYITHDTQFASNHKNSKKYGSRDLMVSHGSGKKCRTVNFQSNFC